MLWIKVNNDSVHFDWMMQTSSNTYWVLQKIMDWYFQQTWNIYIYTAQSTFLTAKQSSLKWNLLCHFYDLKRQMAIAHHTHFDFLIFLVSTLHRFMLSSIANSDHYDNMLKTKYKIYGTHLIYHKLKVFQFLLSFVLFFRSICNAKTIKMNWTT